MVGPVTTKNETRSPTLDCHVRAVVEAGRDTTVVGGIVPHDADSLVGDHERHADRLAGRRIVIVAAVDRAAPEIEDALLILAEPVIMLVRRRVEAGADRKVFSPFTVCGAISQPFMPRKDLPSAPSVIVSATGGSDWGEIALHLRRRLGPGLRRRLSPSAWRRRRCRRRRRC